MGARKMEVPEGLRDKRLPKGYYSNSQYGCYKGCGWAYYLRYVKGIRKLSSPSSLRGKSVHAGVEVCLEARKVGQEMPLEKGLARVADHFKREVKETDWTHAAEGETQDATLRLFKLFFTKALPNIHPVEIEKPFVVRMGSVTVMGFIDMIELARTQPSDPGVLTVTDWKTTEAKWSQSDVDRDTQLTLYTAVTKIPNARIDCLVDTKTPAYHPIPTTRDAQAQKILMEDYEETVDFIARGIFPKAPIDSWKCTPKWCEFWGECRGKKR
jgi:RecB family exonuclease